MAGRRPIPDQIKDLTGSHNKRNSRPLKYRYLKLDGVPIPKDIQRDEVALEEWNAVVPELVQNGLLCRANLRILANYCLAHAEAQHAQDEVFENGRMLEEDVFNRAGEVSGQRMKPNPGITQAHQARLEMLRYAVEFGMTPAAATRVERGDGADAGKDDFGSFMNGPEEEVELESNDESRPN